MLAPADLSSYDLSRVGKGSLFALTVPFCHLRAQGSVSLVHGFTFYGMPELKAFLHFVWKIGTKSEVWHMEYITYSGLRVTDHKSVTFYL